MGSLESFFFPTYGCSRKKAFSSRIEVNATSFELQNSVVWCSRSSLATTTSAYTYQGCCCEFTQLISHFEVVILPFARDALVLSALASNTFEMFRAPGYASVAEEEFRCNR